MKYSSDIERVNIPLPSATYLPSGVRKADKKLTELLRARVMLRADKELIERQIVDAVEADRLSDVEAVAKGKELPPSSVPELEAKRDEVERRIAAMFDLIAEAKHALVDALAEDLTTIHSSALQDVEAKSAAYINAISAVLKARQDYNEALGIVDWATGRGAQEVALFQDREYTRVLFPAHFDSLSTDGIHQAFNTLRDEALTHKPSEQLGHWKGKTDYSIMQY
ncbi:hypothetical protein [Streptosporangium sp. V21-05]|uniref:hypothetical protein n=1 Tax=Streptosporangium sp. V21-05 TaxID=3446115 RepID=UPI003F532C88